MKAKMYVEKRVPIGHLTGEARDGTMLSDFPDKEHATGTSDVVIVSKHTLTTIDAKFGRDKVTAYDILKPAGVDLITGEPTPEVVRMNLQLAMYLDGSLKRYGHPDITHVKAIIVQPYLNHVSEYSCTVEELLSLGEWLKQRAEATRTNKVFSPSEDNCHFCRARFTCKAREQAVLSTALIGFEDVDEAQPKPIQDNQLGSLYAAVGMIRQWCTDVETRTYGELMAGHTVMRNDGLRYKLVTGKKGARQWRDENAAEAAMKRMRLKQDQMYSQKLITPAAAEKLAAVKKPKKGQVATPPLIGETQWKRLQALMKQTDGSPTVALETDPRPEIPSAVAGFEDVAAPIAETCDDLFN